MDELITSTDAGLYCPVGDFHVDPWKPVERAVITHAHSDHARAGCRHYLAAEPGAAILRHRLGAIDLQVAAYGQATCINGVSVSLHPAGHLLGAAQVRVEHAGHVAVVTGDFKTAADSTCAGFEPLRCHHLVTESTFGLPVYRWPATSEVHAEVNRWWRGNRDLGLTSVVYAYALGKAQRVLAGIEPDGDAAPILLHGAVDAITSLYRDAGVALPPAQYATAEAAKATRGRALVIAPMSAHGSPWLKKFHPISTAIASGWMMIRGMRRYRTVDRGFVLSDHADWQGLLETIDASGAERVDVTHGYARPLARYLRETRGHDARPIQTRFEGERLADGEPGDRATADDASGMPLLDNGGAAT